MTQDEIIEMALVVGTIEDGDIFLFTHNELEAFAKLVAAKERGACARLAEEYGTWGGSSFNEWFKKLATEIRARGEQA